MRIGRVVQTKVPLVFRLIHRLTQGPKQHGFYNMPVGPLVDLFSQHLVVHGRRCFTPL